MVPWLSFLRMITFKVQNSDSDFTAFSTTSYMLCHMPWKNVFAEVHNCWLLKLKECKSMGTCPGACAVWSAVELTGMRNWNNEFLDKSWYECIITCQLCILNCSFVYHLKNSWYQGYIKLNKLWTTNIFFTLFLLVDSDVL